MLLATAITISLFGAGQAPDVEAATKTSPGQARSALATMLTQKKTMLTERQTELAYVRGAKGAVRVFVLRVDDETHKTRAEGIRLRISRQGCNREAYVDADDIDPVLSGLKWVKKPPRLGTFQSGEKSVAFEDTLTLRTDYFSTPSAPVHVAIGNCTARFSTKQASGFRRAMRQAQDFLASAK